MTGNELKQSLKNVNTEDRCFIKWWRKENDFADYELIDLFLEQLAPESEFEGFELLSMEDMLKELKRYASNRVWLEEKRDETVLHWQHPGGDGRPRDDTYRYSPKVLMALFEKETHGDTLC
jgi:hypothetical protein